MSDPTHKKELLTPNALAIHTHCIQIEDQSLDKVDFAVHNTEDHLMGAIAEE